MPHPSSASDVRSGADVDLLTFRLADRSRALRGVRLRQDVHVPGDQVDFSWSDGVWELLLERPQVDRVEYLLELTARDGSNQTVPDPANPLRAPGAFGEKSVLELPGYRRPLWLDARAPRGNRRSVKVPTRSLGEHLDVVLWSPAGLPDDRPAPLLVVHDGPEYDDLACLTLFLDAMVAQGRLPALRAALLAPVDRNETYSASPTYGRALALGLVPGLTRTVPTSLVIGMGASLGGLAMLQAQRSHAGVFAGLYLQSSSFFHRVLDEQESGFARFTRITSFVDGVLRAGPAEDPVPVVMSCGLIEENVENNRLMTRALQAQGYDTRLVENRDVHTYTGWRDTFDPHLVDLVRRVLDGPAPDPS